MRKIRRFAMKQKGRPGCGWKRWSSEAIYKEWGLFNDYRVQYFYRLPAKVLLHTRQIASYDEQAQESRMT